MPTATIYVCYLHDRHRDPVVRAFADRERALAYARQWMEDTVHHPHFIEEVECEGYELWLRYGAESDHAFVVAVEMK